MTRDAQGRGEYRPVNDEQDHLLEQIQVIDAQRQDWQRRALDAEGMLRVRDARVEPPPLKIRTLLFWDDDHDPQAMHWSSAETAYYRRELMDHFPYWLQMPPPPEVKQ